MNTDLARFIEAFSHVRVLVVGDAILDGYVEGTTGRLCREAPVPVVTVSRRRHVPGGGANTAANAAALGAHVTLLSAVGDDPDGESALRSASCPWRGGRPDAPRPVAEDVDEDEGDRRFAPPRSVR